jgi:hypothetical protein
LQTTLPPDENELWKTLTLLRFAVQLLGRDVAVTLLEWVLREVVVNSGQSYFDTIVSDHHPAKPPSGRRHPPPRGDDSRRPGLGSSRRLEII